jgi:hypothetical protein
VCCCGSALRLTAARGQGGDGSVVLVAILADPAALQVDRRLDPGACRAGPKTTTLDFTQASEPLSLRQHQQNSPNTLLFSRHVKDPPGRIVADGRVCFARVLVELSVDKAKIQGARP